MAERLSIKAINSTTEEWSCKVQVVDKGQPRDNQQKTKRFQLMLLQDEEETKVEALIFGTDIGHYKELLNPFHTYLVSVANVKQSNDAYGSPIHDFTWTIDSSTIVEPIEKVIPPEDPLPPPTRLTLARFDSLDNQPIRSEFDVLAVVINGCPWTYANNGNRMQEFIIMDYQKKPTKLTLWEELIDHYGNEIFRHLKELKEFAVILAKRVSKSKSSSGLTNRFGTTIHTNPPYPQAVELRTWAKTIEPMLIAYTEKSTGPTGSLLSVPFEEQVVPILNIQEQPPGQIFYVEAELSLHNEDQRFCILVCSSCKKLFPRHFSRRAFYCTTCHQTTHLAPRCQFEVTITDNTGSATMIISDRTGEELLSLTPDEIYDIRCAKRQLLPLTTVQNKLRGKAFNIQMKRSFAKNQDVVPGKLFILSLKDKDKLNHPSLSPTVMDSTESSKSKLHEFAIKEGKHQILSSKGNISHQKHNMGLKGLKGLKRIVGLLLCYHQIFQ